MKDGWAVREKYEARARQGNDAAAVKFSTGFVG